MGKVVLVWITAILPLLILPSADGSQILTEGRVIPENGPWGSTFTFEVTYTDNENILPAFYPTLCINTITVEMTEKAPADSDTVDGKVYEYHWTAAKDDVGDHVFYFYVENGIQSLAYEGPAVTKKLTSLACEVYNPEPAGGETVLFSGYLRTSDENLSIAGENSVLYKFLRENEVIVDSAPTDENGYFTLPLKAPSPGISVYRVRFLGDNYYEASESTSLYLNTLNSPLILGISAVILLLVAGALMFIFSRGMVRSQYLRFVLMGSGIGIFLGLMGAGFLSPLAAGGVAGYLFAKETPGWTKHLRVGCMAWLLVLPLVGIRSMYFITKSPELFAYSITQSEFMAFLYPIITISLPWVLVAGLAATVGGVLRGGLKPKEIRG